MNLDVSRESLRVPEQGGAGSGWGLGKTTWQPSEGNREAGRTETVAAVRRAARGWGGRSRGRLPALWPAVGPPTSGPGHYSPWIPIMCSRMRTLSARIFKASRSCCTPSPWKGGNGESQGRAASSHMPPFPPRPACHHRHYNSHHPLCVGDAA